MAISEELRIEITAQANRAVGELKKVEKATGGISKSLKGVAIGAAVLVGVRALGKGLKDVIAAASNAEETANKFNVTFATLGPKAGKAATDLAKGYGIADEESQRLLSSTADLLQGFGVTKDASLDLSLKTQQLAADLASFANIQGGAAAASAALTSGLLGEREAMKSLGIAITEAELQRFAEDMGYTYSEMTKAEKAALTLELAYKQSANAIGDFERSQFSFANQTRIAQASMKNLSSSIGEIFLPFATLAVTAFNEMSGGISDTVDSIKEFLGEESIIDKIATAVSTVTATFSILWEIVKQVFNNIIDAIKVVFGPIADLVSGVGKATFVFDILAGIMEVVGSVSRVVATAIKEQVETIIQFGKASVASFNVIRAGVDRLKGDMSKEEFRGIAADAGEAWKGVGEEMLENFTEPFNVAVNEGRSFLGNVRDQAEEYQAIWTDAKNGAYAAVSGSLSGANNTPPVPTTGGGTSGEDETPLGEPQLSAAEAYYNNLVSMKQSAAEREAEIDRAFFDAKMEMIDEEVSRRVEMMNMINAQAEATGEYIGKVIQGEMSLAEAAKNVATDVISTMLKALGQQYAVEAAAAIASSIWPPNPAGLAKGAGLGAASAAAFAAAGLVKSFATGGVVPGTSYTGDNVPALVNSGEMILNQGQQSQLFSMLNGGGGGGVTIVINGAVGGQEEVAEWVQEGLDRARRTGRVAA